MDPIECTIHSFIIKIWLEESVEEAGKARWRGRITHVGSGAQEHFQDMQQIERFILFYLQDMGAGRGARQFTELLSKRWRLRRWLGRLLR